MSYRPRKKTPPKKNPYHNEPYKSKKEKAKKTIPMEVVKKFIGKIENLHLIDVTNISGTSSFRIDVWVSYFFFEHQCYPSYKVGHSWFVHYNEETQEITDKTVQPKISEEDLLKSKKRKLPSLKDKD